MIEIKHRQKRVRTPTILQTEAVECGAACLGMILAYYGKYVTLEELRYECDVSRDGSKATNILKAARTFGLSAKGFKMDMHGIKEMEFPAVIFWNFNHFVVFEGYKKGFFYVNDPGFGRRKISQADFEKSFTGVVLTFGVTESFKKGGEKPAPMKSLMASFVHDKKTLFFLAVTSALMTFGGILIPSFSRIFVDNVLIRKSNMNGEWLNSLLMAMGITAAVMGIIVLLQEKTLLNLENRISISNSAGFFRHVIRLPIMFFSQRYAGNISSIMFSGEGMAKSLANVFLISVINMVFSVFYLAIMLQYDVILSLVALVFAFFNIVFVYFSSLKIKNEYRTLVNDEGKLSGIAFSGIQSIETLKATAQESIFFTKLADQYSNLQNTLFKINQKELYLNSVPRFLQFLSFAMLFLVGGLRIMDGSMSIGTFVAFQILSAAFYTPVQRFVEIMISVQKMEADKLRFDDVQNYPEDEYLKNDLITSYGKEIKYGKLDGKLEIKNLSFGYNRLSVPLIESFNLEIEPGKRVAFVGSSGSGKSTLAKLICGLLQPISGEILIDSKPLKHIPRNCLNASMSYVEQDVILFSGTVRDNISMWNPVINESQILEASKDACVHDEITSMDGEYSHLLSEFGGNLSGGIRQRIEIARCLAVNPTILVMDEATSALDAKTEMEIDLNIRKRGCTVIVVSHRLSTIRDCDEIIVLDKGKVVQRGKHEDLIMQDGLYSKLIAM